MASEGIEGTSEFRNMEDVPTLDDLSVETVNGRANAFNFEFGIITKSGVTTEEATVRGERLVVVEHGVGGTSICAALVLGRIIHGDARVLGREGSLSNGVELCGQETGRRSTRSCTMLDLTLLFEDLSRLRETAKWETIHSRETWRVRIIGVVISISTIAANNKLPIDGWFVFLVRAGGKKIVVSIGWNGRSMDVWAWSRRWRRGRRYWLDALGGWLRLRRSGGSATCTRSTAATAASSSPTGIVGRLGELLVEETRDFCSCLLIDLAQEPILGERWASDVAMKLDLIGLVGGLVMASRARVGELASGCGNPPRDSLFWRISRCQRRWLNLGNLIFRRLGVVADALDRRDVTRLGATRRETTVQDLVAAILLRHHGLEREEGGPGECWIIGNVAADQTGVPILVEIGNGE
jgi:hypothetical protein